MRFYKLLVFTLLFPLSFTANAKSFSNGYTQFELPPGWQCSIEGSEWVCQSENKDRQKEAIIILAAKKRGSQDTLTAYKAYLGQTKSYQLPGSKIQKSEPKTVKMKSVNGHQWVDALHLASEVPGFYTRYLATIKADIGVAVTFSVTKSMYNAYKGIFDKVIASMRVFRQTKTDLAGLNIKSNNRENFDDATFEPQDSGLDITRAETKVRKPKKAGADTDMIIIIVIAVVAGVVLLKLRSKKSGAPKKKKKKKKKE